jgi:uncharacterized protein YcaQ
MLDLPVSSARRLALCKAGLLKPEWTGLPRRATGTGQRARKAGLAIVKRFGYLQLDTVSIAGARSHAIVLMSRIDGFEPRLAEKLLQPGEPIFEYWGHEASWIPMELYPNFAFRREAFAHHPWWGDLIGQHPQVARDLVERIRSEGPLRSADMEGSSGQGWWDLKLSKRVATALWSSGELAISERRNFQRIYDLAERVIPEAIFHRRMAKDEALEALLLQALEGHGWATTSTLAQTWRLKNMQRVISSALDRLTEMGTIEACTLIRTDGALRRGWIRPADLELVGRLERVRPRRDRGVLLSPFDPVLWDRRRVEDLFGFHQVLEIFKPASQRRYGYYCLPVLAGADLVARFDLKADHRNGRLKVLSFHEEAGAKARASASTACSWALTRFATSLGLIPDEHNRR